LGQAQAGGAAPPSAGAGFDFHRGPHSHPAQSARPTRGNASRWRHGIAAGAAASSLRRAQTQAVHRICPGDLVEVDTLDVRAVPGVGFKQFTARDVVSRLPSGEISAM